MEPLELFFALFKASALSIGGTSALPLLRQEFVTSGILTDANILEALAIGRLAPGPSGLYIVSLGYFALGWLGAALAVIACALPPMTLVAVAALARRRLVSRWATGAIRGLTLVTSGLVISTTSAVFATELAGGAALLWQFALVGIGAGAVAHGRRHPLWFIGIGAAIGLAVAR